MAREITLQRSLARLVNPVWVVLAAAVVGWAIIQTSPWRHVELRLFDFLVQRSAPNQVTLPITIVGIDEETFSTLKSGWPLPRRYHAQVLDNLREAGVAVVGFDIVFSEPSTPEDDEPFMAALEHFRRVVIASDLSFREDSAIRQWYRVDPHKMFLSAGAWQGYASMQVDDDAVIRRVPTIQDSFWRAMLQEFDKVHPGVAAVMEGSEDMRIRYLGGPHTFTYVPYHHLLDPDKHLPQGWRDFFKSNIVLVGRNLNVISDVGAAQAEMYQTPFFHRTREFMPRVEVHANLIANMIAGEVLREAPADWSLGIWAVTALLGLLFIRRWHPVWSGIVLAVLVAILGATEYLAFQHLKVWIPAVGAMLTAGLIYGSQGAVAFISERRQRQEIRNAFSMYVSPTVVDEVIAHPERLKLGGERRELTVLFSDLAGFTTIAEGFEPETVAAIVNRHLSEMTEIILQHHGTIDKFIGDGIMAFWGAPIADERQSEQAVKAAVDMQKKMDIASAEIAAETGAVLKMRIGINRGPCIVGNMGGSGRFDYTVMGDTINLASRLEGVNKAYGTRILVSEAVVKAVGEKVRFREVDTVRVKGKHIGIVVYTPCDDEALIALSDRALAAYRAGKFEEAEGLWMRLLDAYPGDPVATTGVARMVKFKEQCAPAEWDGITTLEEK